MKKLLLIVLGGLMLVSCGGTTSTSNTSISFDDVSIIAPDGTPALALANYYAEHVSEGSTFDIKAGSDPLVAAFTSGSYDIIVAPTNLGAKMYNSNNGEKYLHYQTIVWGNLYVASKQEIHSLEDLNGKNLTLFGKNSTPDIVIQSLIKAKDLDIDLTYTDDVGTANSLLVSNEAEYIISAQPSLTKLMSSQNLYTIDLQDVWSETFSQNSYPQASIFFKESLKGKIDSILEALSDSVVAANKNPEQTAKNAVSMYQTFKALGEDILKEAIPHCHYQISDNDKEAIELYFNKMNELSLSAQYGNKLPDENFYYSI